MMKDVTNMSDAELAELVEQADTVAAARREIEHRKATSDSNSIGVRAVPQPCVKRTSKAACPKCGRNDAWIASKTLYDSPDLAHGGNAIGTAVYCGGSCRTWYDSTTGEYVNMGKAYTY